MREQIELKFQVGYPTSTPYTRVVAFERHVCQEISRICGGCETSHTKGWWRDDGADHKTAFRGILQEENTLTFTVTCEKLKVDLAYKITKEALCDAALVFRIETDWIHVKESSVLGRHFSVKEVNREDV